MNKLMELAWAPITPCMADVCMNWVLNQALNNANLHQPTILRRCVDDLFCLFNNKAQLNDFFDTLNASQANIKFTKELEHENQLAYFDVLLTRNNDSIKATVFARKPTLVFISNGLVCVQLHTKIQVQFNDLFT